MARWIRIGFISILILFLIVVLIGQIDKHVYVHRLQRIDRIDTMLENGQRPEMRHYRFLSRTIGNNRSELAGKALKTLYRIDDKEAVRELMTALDSRNYYIRKYAAFYLGDLGAAEAVDLLIERLDDDNHKIRAEAALALGKIGDTAAVPHLEDKLSDYYDDVVLASTMALGEFASPSSTTGIVENLTHKDDSVREQSMFALKRINTPDIWPLIEKELKKYPSGKERRCLVMALTDLDRTCYTEFMTEELDCLIRLYERDRVDLEQVFAVMKYLGKRDSTPAAAALMSAVSSEDSISSHAVDLISENYSSRYRTLLMKALEDDIYLNNTNIKLIGIMGEVKDTLAVDFLINMYESTRIYNVRSAVAKALGSIGDKKATPILVKSLINDRCELRRHAARSLADIQDSSAIGPLVATLACPYSMRFASMALDSLNWRPESDYDKVHYYIASGRHIKLLEMKGTAREIMTKDLEEGYVTRFDSLYVLAYKMIFSKQEFIEQFERYADLRVVEIFENSNDVIIGQAIEKWRIRQSFYNTKYQYK